MPLKLNVVKTCWKVVSRAKWSHFKRVNFVWAESEEVARLQIPQEEEVLTVERMDGREAEK